MPVSDAHPPDPHEYEIVLRGHLDERWSESFPGLVFAHPFDPDGTPLTVLRGSVIDEAELHGLLARIRDLGVPLISVKRTPDRDDEAQVETT